jgi:hypothetical protein
LLLACWLPERVEHPYYTGHAMVGTPPSACILQHARWPLTAHDTAEAAMMPAQNCGTAGPLATHPTDCTLPPSARPWTTAAAGGSVAAVAMRPHTLTRCMLQHLVLPGWQLACQHKTHCVHGLPVCTAHHTSPSPWLRSSKFCAAMRSCLLAPVPLHKPQPTPSSPQQCPPHTAAARTAVHMQLRRLLLLRRQRQCQGAHPSTKQPPWSIMFDQSNTQGAGRPPLT